MILCFAWQRLEHTSDAAGNWIGFWLQQFAEHEVLCSKAHYSSKSVSLRDFGYQRGGSKIGGPEEGDMSGIQEPINCSAR